MKKLLFCTAVVLLNLAGNVLAQQGQMDSIKIKFEYFRQHSLQEKIFVHLDRNFYVTGEKLWFKIYQVDGSLHKALNIDKVVYVEILDRQNIPVLTGKVLTTNGSGSGSFFLPASLQSDKYTVRAYTEWMKNFSPEFFFHTTITIVNTFAAPGPQASSTSRRQYHVDIFPEGGHLVKGIKSRVAFKVADAQGQPVNCKVAVVNTHHDTIAVANSLHAGIGQFSYIPEGNEHLVMVGTNLPQTRYELPIAKNRGYVMSLADSTELIKITVASTIEDNEAPFIYLFGHCRQQIFFSESKISRRQISFFIPKKNLGEGINHFTVFDGSLNPICERLYFKYPSRNVATEILTDQSLYETRKKLKLNIRTAIDSQPVTAHLSVSIFKLDSLSTKEEQGITEYLWLTSDLQGKIDSPGYYFSNDVNAKQAMDNLMLSHGWRRFSWNDILTKKTANDYYPEYRHMIVKAQVTDEDGKPTAHKVVYLASPDTVTRFYPAVSSSTGEVKFETTHLFGNRPLILTSPDSTVKLEMKSPFFKKYSNYVTPQFGLTPENESALTERSVGMQVQDVYDEKNRGRFLSPGIDSTAFYGHADETYLLDDYTRFPVMEEVMREYVTGVMVRKKRDGFHFILLDKVNTGVIENEPLILVDGVPVFDVDKIMAFDPLKIKKLEVVTRPYYIGSFILNGIVSYSTYRGDLGGFNINPNAVTIDYEGLQLQREFYSPKYETAKQRDDRTPDFRNLLLWAPNVSTNKTGQASLEVFTSDVEGKYLIQLYGLSNDGTPISSSYSFDVKRFDN